MSNLRRKLPPMTALTAFEAAARLKSFTKAAAELAVTQAAVSRQIHLLEKDFGFSLFIRLHRGIDLTERGRLLASVASDAFNMLAGAVAEISRKTASQELTISASVAFSHFWLLPHISDFLAKNQDVKLRIVTQDATPDLSYSEIDLAIRFGNGLWTDGKAELLFDDEVFPICSPEFARLLENVQSIQDLAAFPLISSDTHDPSWTGWQELFAHFDAEAPKGFSGLRCSFYTEAIHAALAGQGIALGWKRLVQDLLDQGRLVRPTPYSVKARSAYFVVVAKSKAKKPNVQQFVQWLREAH